MMSSHMALPREGHLEQIFHIFSYLRKYHNTEMVLDPSDFVIDESKYQRRDWTSSEFGHLPAQRQVPPNSLDVQSLLWYLDSSMTKSLGSNTISVV